MQNLESNGRESTDGPSRRQLFTAIGVTGAAAAVASSVPAAASPATGASSSASQNSQGYDVAVIGLGSVGSFAAQTMAARGLDVLGLEAGPVAHDNCGVGGDTRLYRRVYREGTHYYPLLERSLELWAEIEDRVGNDVFRQCGVLTLVDDGSDNDRALSSYAEQFGLEHERLAGADVIERYPQYQPQQGMVGHLDPGGGYLRSDRLVLDAATRAREAGMTHVTGHVTDIEREADGYRIHCDDEETFFCRRVVLSAGARTRDLLPSRLREFFTPQRSVITWFTAEDPAQYAADKFPCFSHKAAGIDMYGVPSIDGSSVKAAGLISRTPAEFDGFDIDSRVSTAEKFQAADGIGDVFTGLESTPTRARGYPDLYTSDGDFVVDFLDSDRTAVVATGFSGGGFKMSSGLGEHVAELITGDADPYPAFSLSRFGG